MTETPAPGDGELRFGEDAHEGMFGPRMVAVPREPQSLGGGEGNEPPYGQRLSLVKRAIPLTGGVARAPRASG